MQSRRWIVLLVAVLPAIALAAELPTAQRLDLLERRVGRITELTLQLDEMRRENRQLRGEVEQLGHQIRQLERKQRDIYLDIDQRLGSLQGGAAPASAATPAPVASAVISSSQPSAGQTRAEAQAAAQPTMTGTDRERIEAEYKAAYALLSPQQKRYKEAAEAFTAFIEAYPQDQLTPNAQYWLGEAYYVSQRNAEAQQAFEQVVSRYPDDAKAPGALYKLGRLQEVSGKQDAALASYRQVLEQYPNSPAAGLARQRLDQAAR